VNAEERRCAKYEAARQRRDAKWENASQALCDASNAYQNSMWAAENEYFTELDVADGAYERARKRKRKQKQKRSR
jgi:hypothetical protein